MELFTKDIEARLLINGRNRDQDHPPVVKIFNPMGSATWLINEMDPATPDLLFGLCDLGIPRIEPSPGYFEQGTYATTGKISSKIYA